ncbi:D-alanyl-D-alanine carboxypeptidase family protein [Butyrivibrio sp. MC2013]|uniref:D-alanyl-D-alanine carboxypeptidase family protein n=1 Tax=Butyrivibrio sp. MC2013 TaxID=1280686 RepID=UPI000687E0E5|nr:D-alanyl-D-alanine carboxypeptidase family protein [Butyrivibrio sp. MC2013]
MLPVSKTYSLSANAESLEEARQARMELETSSNLVPGWPQGPAVGAESAILMDADSKVILYSKNIDEELYPASTTKMLTCLIAAEKGNMNDIVNFSHTAVSSVPSDGSNIGIDAGEYMTLEQCLYGIMVGSANECANAVAEHIAGSLDAFADMMNERALELGCSHSHFVNSNGLFDKEHYTSAHDLALIASAFFDNELLSKIGNTARYHFTAGPGQPDDFYVNNKHKLINGEIACEGIRGGKTGYTDEARNTLISCAERGQMKLICVIMKEETPYQFTETAELFDYGFNNFKKVYPAEEDEYYLPSTSKNSSSSSFSLNKEFLEFDKNASVILPVTASLSDCESTADYDTKDENTAAVISYSFGGVAVGEASIRIVASDEALYLGNKPLSLVDVIEGKKGTYYLDLKSLIIRISLTLSVIIVFSLILSAIYSYKYGYGDKGDRKRMRRRLKTKGSHHYH